MVPFVFLSAASRKHGVIGMRQGGSAALVGVGLVGQVGAAAGGVAGAAVLGGGVVEAGVLGLVQGGGRRRWG